MERIFRLLRELVMDQREAVQASYKLGWAEWHTSSRLSPTVGNCPWGCPGDDTAHSQCVLRSADERHQFSCRRAAATALRSEDGRRAQLRQYRRYHRARANARLR